MVSGFGLGFETSWGIMPIRYDVPSTFVEQATEKNSSPQSSGLDSLIFQGN
jgi:hypothetical protein